MTWISGEFHDDEAAGTHSEANGDRDIDIRIRLIRHNALTISDHLWIGVSPFNWNVEEEHACYTANRDIQLQGETDKV